MPFVVTPKSKNNDSVDQVVIAVFQRCIVRSKVRPVIQRVGCCGSRGRRLAVFSVVFGRNESSAKSSSKDVASKPESATGLRLAVFSVVFGRNESSAKSSSKDVASKPESATGLSSEISPVDISSSSCHSASARPITSAGSGRGVGCCDSTDRPLVAFAVFDRDESSIKSSSKDVSSEPESATELSSEISLLDMFSSSSRDCASGAACNFGKADANQKRPYDQYSSRHPPQ